MSLTPERKLLKQFQKARQQLSRGIAFPVEYVNKCLLLLAVSEVFPQVVPQLWELIHDSCKAEFKIKIRDALAADFVFAPILFGVPACTPEEHQRRTDQITHRLREWAVAFTNYSNQSVVHS
jgi:hypothetical protein